MKELVNKTAADGETYAAMTFSSLVGFPNISHLPVCSSHQDINQVIDIAIIRHSSQTPERQKGINVGSRLSDGSTWWKDYNVQMFRRQSGGYFWPGGNVSARAGVVVDNESQDKQTRPGK